eukprot:363466-Chlamydomonas_euryale.AAC.9
MPGAMSGGAEEPWGLESIHHARWRHACMHGAVVARASAPGSGFQRRRMRSTSGMIWEERSVSAFRCCRRWCLSASAVKGRSLLRRSHSCCGSVQLPGCATHRQAESRHLDPLAPPPPPPVRRSVALTLRQTVSPETLHHALYTVDA